MNSIHGICSIYVSYKQMQRIHTHETIQLNPVDCFCTIHNIIEGKMWSPPVIYKHQLYTLLKEYRNLSLFVTTLSSDLTTRLGSLIEWRRPWLKWRGAGRFASAAPLEQPLRFISSWGKALIEGQDFPLGGLVEVRGESVLELWRRQQKSHDCCITVITFDPGGCVGTTKNIEDRKSYWQPQRKQNPLSLSPGERESLLRATTEWLPLCGPSRYDGPPVFWL